MKIIPLDAMSHKLQEDHVDNLQFYLAVALVPLQVVIDEEKFPTEESRRALVKQSLKEMGFIGAVVKSIEPIPKIRH